MTIDVAAAAVTGSRHLRAARNGQDAAAVWRGEGAAAVVVCDGCGSGASSEVGARLGASVFVRALGERLAAGARVDDAATWHDARAELVRVLAALLDRLAGDPTRALHDHLLFTVVAAAISGDAAAVWMVGDGAYALGDDARAVGPFADNEPPYVGYDLLGATSAASFEVAPAGCRSLVVATDGAFELADGIAALAAPRYIAHPDALRRHLVVQTHARERIDWDARRVVHVPAALQDDCAIGVLRRSAS